MRQRFILVLFFSLIMQTLFSQESDSLNLKPSMLRINLLSPGIATEIHVWKQSTIIISTNIGLDIIKKTYLDESSAYVAYPTVLITIQYRMYTNLLERVRNGKTVDYYSGAYGAFLVNFTKGTFENPDLFQFGPLLGFQRTFWKHCYWNAAIGLGAKFIQHETRFGLLGDLGLGFVF